MKTIKELERRLDEIDTEISDLRGEQYEIEDKIDRLRGYEELEPVVLASLNRNYNRWCSHDYLEKNICWDDTDLDPDDAENNLYKAIAVCELLVEKGIAQRKETGSYDDDLEPICDYRITDTETPDMFGGNEVQPWVKARKEERK